MGSSFSWIDFTEEDRRRTQDVLDLLHEPDTRDELGLGTIRDAIGDQLFPGSGTLQTRARYFFFVPWTYLALARKGIAANDVAEKARRLEVRLIKPLLASEDNEGVVGARAGEDVQRLASSIYWAGLSKLGIRRFQGSQDQYHRQFARLHADVTVDDDHEPLGDISGAWDPGLPPAPAEFPDSATFALSSDEAEYLRDRILGRSSFYAEVLRHGEPGLACEFAWEHPAASACGGRVAVLLAHARAFSELMHGASLLYNLMLSQEGHFDAEARDYLDRLGRWAELHGVREREHRTWSEDLASFWAALQEGGASISPRTRQFVASWLEIVRAGAKDVATSPRAKDLVRVRERQLKRGRARLGNASALQRWGGTAGAGQLGYRWFRVQKIADDILRGLAA
jgi:hypothetical protein